MDWARILAYITGTVDQELLLRNEYLAAENRILKAQLKTPLRLTDAERMTLAEIAHRLGRKAREDVANVVKPDTLLGWYPIKRLAIFCNATVFRLHRSASARQLGPTSSVHICLSLRVPTFSPWRY